MQSSEESIHDTGSREEVSPNHSEEQVSTRNKQDLLAKLGDRLIMTHLNDNLGVTDPSGRLQGTDDLHLLPEDGIHTDFSERMNHESLITCNAKGEAYLSTAKPLQSFQFMRVGYFCKDSKSEGNVFNRVVGLKDGYKK